MPYRRKLQKGNAAALADEAFSHPADAAAEDIPDYNSKSK